MSWVERKKQRRGFAAWLASTHNISPARATEKNEEKARFLLLNVEMLCIPLLLKKRPSDLLQKYINKIWKGFWSVAIYKMSRFFFFFSVCYVPAATIVCSVFLCSFPFAANSHGVECEWIKDSFFWSHSMADKSYDISLFPKINFFFLLAFWRRFNYMGNGCLRNQPAGKWRI